MQSAAPILIGPSRIRKFTPLAVFLVGLTLTACFYAVVTSPWLQGSLVHRYFCGHPIEGWTTWLFFWGMSALAWKAWSLMAERRVLRQPMFQFQPGRTVNVVEISKLLEALGFLSGQALKTWFVRRIGHALTYAQHSGSGEGLEERLEVLADRDVNELEGSYELVRTVTWAIPILGFLGTVVGITIAIANITPEQLQDSLDEVVGGLAVAFDTTALALALSMVIVLSKFFVERMERAVLARVDGAVEDLVLHRFEKRTPESQAFLGVVEGVAKVVLHATRDAWREQGQLWTRTVEHVGESQVAALENAAQKVIEQSGQIGRKLVADQSYQFAEILKRLEKLQEAGTGTVNSLRDVSREWVTHARDEAHQSAVTQETQFQQFLGELEALRQVCHKSLTNVAGKMTMHQATVKRQTELLAQLVADEGRVSKFQQALHNNLATLANVQALDDAIHSLSAAAHVLITRAGRVVNAPRLSDSNDSVTEEAA